MLNLVSILIGLVTLVLGLVAFIPLLGWIPLAIKGYRGHRLGRRGQQP